MLTRPSLSEKNTAEDALIEAMIQMSSALYVYGRKEGIAHIQSLCDFSESSLKKMRDSELLQKGKSLVQAVQQHVDNLAKSGVSAETVSDFEGKLTAHENALGGKDSKFAESKTARTTLSDLFDKANEILKEDLDPLMELIRSKHGGFYNQYVAARVIKDL